MGLHQNADPIHKGRRRSHTTHVPSQVTTKRFIVARRLRDDEKSQKRLHKETEKKYDEITPTESP